MTSRNGKNNRNVHEEYEAYGKFGYSYTGEENQQQTGASPQSDAQQQSEPSAKKSRARKADSIFFRVFLLFALLAVGIVVLLQTVFCLESVRVYGHVTRSAREIVNLSGLTYGQNIFTVDPEEVRARLEKDHTLILKDVQVKHPNLVYLQVEERHPVSIMQWLGVYYVLDKDGLVMDESTGTELVGTLPLVTGFRVSYAHTGQFLNVKSQLQLEAYSKLIQELNMQKYAKHITEIRLSDPENIYVVTSEGISVRIGRPEDLKRKVQAMRTAMSYLRALEETKGVLDVNVPTNVKYRSGD